MKFSTQLTDQVLIAKMQFAVDIPLNISTRKVCIKLINYYLVDYLLNGLAAHHKYSCGFPTFYH